MIIETKKVKIELMNYELELIIDELSRVPHNLYQHFGYEKIIKKLKGVCK